MILGEASADDQRAFDSWIQDPTHQAHYAQVKRSLELATQHLAKRQSGDLQSTINVDHEWAKFGSRVGYQKKDNVRSLFTPTWVRIAAAVLVVVGAAMIINRSMSDQAGMEFQTAADTQQITLPDGTHVTLNRNSMLSYDGNFNDLDRTVQLSGEAFFDVTPNPQKPFIISSGSARVEVVGTSFNVAAPENENSVTVSVETGVVRLSRASADNSLELRAGEAGALPRDPNGQPARIDRDVNYRSWATQHVEFNGTSLRDVVKTLNATYGSNIVIAGAVSDDCVLTTTFDQQTLEDVLRVLESTLDLTYRINGKTIEIISAKC